MGVEQLDQQRRHHAHPEHVRHAQPHHAVRRRPRCRPAARRRPAPRLPSPRRAAAAPGPSRSARSLRASGRTGWCRAGSRGGRCGAPRSCARRPAGARRPTACRRAPVPGRNAGRSTPARLFMVAIVRYQDDILCTSAHSAATFSGQSLAKAQFPCPAVATPRRRRLRTHALRSVHLHVHFCTHWWARCYLFNQSHARHTSSRAKDLNA